MDSVSIADRKNPKTNWLFFFLCNDPSCYRHIVHDGDCCRDGRGGREDKHDAVVVNKVNRCLVHTVSLTTILCLSYIDTTMVTTGTIYVNSLNTNDNVNVGAGDGDGYDNRQHDVYGCATGRRRRWTPDNGHQCCPRRRMRTFGVEECDLINHVYTSGKTCISFQFVYVLEKNSLNLQFVQKKFFFFTKDPKKTLVVCSCVLRRATPSLICETATVMAPPLPVTVTARRDFEGYERNKFRY